MATLWSNLGDQLNRDRKKNGNEWKAKKTICQLYHRQYGKQCSKGQPSCPTTRGRFFCNVKFRRRPEKSWNGRGDELSILSSKTSKPPSNFGLPAYKTRTNLQKFRISGTLSSYPYSKPLRGGREKKTKRRIHLVLQNLRISEVVYQPLATRPINNTFLSPWPQNVNTATPSHLHSLQCLNLKRVSSLGAPVSGPYLLASSSHFAFIKGSAVLLCNRVRIWSIRERDLLKCSPWSSK